MYILDKYVQKFNKKYFLQNLYFALECIYSFLPFNFVIWQVACEYFYSLKHIQFTYFRPIPLKMKLKILYFSQF